MKIIKRLFGLVGFVLLGIIIVFFVLDTKLDLLNVKISSSDSMTLDLVLSDFSGKTIESYYYTSDDKGATVKLDYKRLLGATSSSTVFYQRTDDKQYKLTTDGTVWSSKEFEYDASYELFSRVKKLFNSKNYDFNKDSGKYYLKESVKDLTLFDMSVTSATVSISIVGTSASMRLILTDGDSQYVVEALVDNFKRATVELPTVG